MNRAFKAFNNFTFQQKACLKKERLVYQSSIIIAECAVFTDK